MRNLAGNEVAAVSGGDLADLLDHESLITRIAIHIARTIAGAQPDGTQMSDIQAP